MSHSCTYRVADRTTHSPLTRTVNTHCELVTLFCKTAIFKIMYFPFIKIVTKGNFCKVRKRREKHLKFQSFIFATL